MNRIPKYKYLSIFELRKLLRLSHCNEVILNTLRERVQAAGLDTQRELFFNMQQEERYAVFGDYNPIEEIKRREQELGK